MPTPMDGEGIRINGLMWTSVPSPFSELEDSSVWVYQGEDVYAKKPLYMRAHLVDKETTLDEFVLNDTLRYLYVAGAPGCGKTTFIHYWARKLAAKDAKRILFVNYREGMDCSVFVADGSALQKYNATIDETELVKVVDTILADHREKFDVCIFDGFRQSEQVCKDVRSAINTNTGGTRKINKSIHVTSLFFVLRFGDANMGIGTKISQIYFDSWVHSDHVEAFKNFNDRGMINEELKEDVVKITAGDVHDDDRTDESKQMNSEDMMESGDDVTLTDAMIEEYVALKFYFAGGSARFMFDFTYVALAESLTVQIGRIDNWEAFASTSIGAHSAYSVNSLMQQFMAADGVVQKCTPLSHFVLMEAYERCQDKLVNAVSAVADACENPALKGWAFELKQLDLIKKAMRTSSVEPKKHLSVDNFLYIPISEAEYNGKSLLANNLQDMGGVIWCLKWNQGCFDVAFFSNKTLITLQFTVAGEHSLKLKYVKELRDALVANNKAVNTVMHVGIVNGNLEAFKFKSPSGTGRATRSGCEVEFEVSVCKSAKLGLMHGTSVVVKESLDFQEIEKIQIYNKKRKAAG